MKYNKFRPLKDIAIEMNLWEMLRGRYLKIEGSEYDGKPVEGKITDVEYLKGRRNMVIINLDNGSEGTLKVRYGKPVIPANCVIGEKA